MPETIDPRPGPYAGHAPDPWPPPGRTYGQRIAAEVDAVDARWAELAAAGDRRRHANRCRRRRVSLPVVQPVGFAQRERFARPWCLPRPVPPVDGYLAHGDTFVVPGIAEIAAAPHRSRRTARDFARRIAAEPAAYLDVLTAFALPGIVDLRPTSHARGGTPWAELRKAVPHA